MRHLHILTFLIVTLSQATQPVSAQMEIDKPQVVAEKVWATADLLTTCESVCYNPSDKTLFASCIDGNPTEKDRNGFISRLSLTGEILQLKWIDGLNAPKGMGIFNNKLYVTDIDEIVEIDIENAVIIKKYAVAEAKFLNDITVDFEGSIYVSDMATAKIHRIKKGVLETWFTNSELQGPNGLFYEDKEILIGTKNGIFSVRIEDKRIWQLIGDTGGIDGLEADGKGNYIISDWVGKIQLVNPENDPIELINTGDQGINAADIEYIIDRELLLVPTFGDNRVVAYQLTYR
ncbi:MAG: hypothetical protein R2764_20390 [Bacteroidales bacterium]